MDEQDDDVTGADAPHTESGDAGWSVESNSVSPVESPSDTTIEPHGINNEPAVGDEAADEVTTEESASAETPAATKTEVKFVATVKPKKNESAQQRINDLTKKRRDAEALANQRQTENEALQARIAALEKGVKPALEEPKPAAVVATADPALEIPDPPNYIDFDSDDAFKTAMTGWRKKVLEVQSAREEALGNRLKTEITTGLETRLTTEQQRQGAQQAERALGQRMQAMKQAHPDFDEVLKANADVLSQTKHPFIQDIIVNTPEGAEFLNDLVRDVDTTLALAALPLPTRPLADAVRESPMSRQIMSFFATDDGAEAYNRLRALPPTRVYAEIGKLENALVAAASAPAPGARHSITHAAPPAKAPVGAPRARESSAVAGAPPPFEDWMADEDRRETAEKLRRAGVAVPA